MGDEIEFDPAMFEGLMIPEYCPRGRDDCCSLNFIIAHGHESFICCGANDGENREVDQDKYRVCFKNKIIDDMQDYDKRDLTQTAAVLLGGLAIIENHDSAEYHNPPETSVQGAKDETR